MVLNCLNPDIDTKDGSGLVFDSAWCYRRALRAPSDLKRDKNGHLAVMGP